MHNKQHKVPTFVIHTLKEKATQKTRISYLQKQVMSFLFWRTKPIQQTHTYREISEHNYDFWTTLNKPYIHSLYTLTAVLKWFQAAFTIFQHSSSHDIFNKWACTTPILWQMLGYTGLVAGHQLLVRGVSESHHPNTFWLWKRWQEGRQRICTHVSISPQKTSKNGKVEMQVWKRFKCNYQHQFLQLNSLDFGLFLLMTFMSSKIKVVRPRKILKMLTHKMQLLSIFHYHTDFKNTEQPASHLALARDKCLR